MDEQGQIVFARLLQHEITERIFGRVERDFLRDGLFQIRLERVVIDAIKRRCHDEQAQKQGESGHYLIGWQRLRTERAA